MTYRLTYRVLASVLCVGLCRMAHAENETAASIQVTSPSRGETRCADSKHPQYKWVEVTDKAAFAPRDGAGALVFKDRMWLLGGWGPWDKVHFPRICNNEVWSSTDGAAWTLVKPNTFVDRSFVHAGALWMAAGNNLRWTSDRSVWKLVCTSEAGIQAQVD